MALAARKYTRKPSPALNLSDIPELMPGAGPRASATQRSDFDRQCRMLYEQETQAEVVSKPSSDADDVTSADLVAMFPTLDPVLVETLIKEALTPMHAIETLLALTATQGETQEQDLSPHEVLVGDHEKFPVLTDSQGWQVINHHQLDRNPDEELGNAWCERAKIAAQLPTSSARVQKAMPSATVGRSSKKVPLQDSVLDPPNEDMEYELRQKKGQQHAQSRALRKRGLKAHTEPTEGALDANIEMTEDDGSDLAHISAGG